MQLGRNVGQDWRNAIWKIVSNPALEVLAAIAVVLFAAWLVVSFESEQKHTLYPIPAATR
jgi:hypothetical protein